MALVDVSDLLSDTDFCDSFIVVKRVATVNEFGETNITELQEATVGVVQNSAQESLAFMESGVQLSVSIKVYTKKALSAQSEGRLADIIVWCGERYIVKSVQPWYNYGVGYCRAVCILEQESR